MTGSLNQLSKHNLGGTLTLPTIKSVTTATAEKQRFEMAKEELQRYCRVFHVDYERLFTDMMERLTTNQFDNWRTAIDWAKRRIQSGDAIKLPPKKKPGEA